MLFLQPFRLSPQLENLFTTESGTRPVGDDFSIEKGDSIKFSRTEAVLIKPNPIEKRG